MTCFESHTEEENEGKDVAEEEDEKDEEEDGEK